MNKDQESLRIKSGTASVHQGRGNTSPRKKFVKKRKPVDVKALAEALSNGEKQQLAKAITLIESTEKNDQKDAQKLLQHLQSKDINSIRIGISGVPGAGKSTFIEAFGLMLCEMGLKVAVLAIDPSSSLTGGSVLGDKTRMERLSMHENAFIRPSPTSGTLGGVHSKTRETIHLCEAAGFDIILAETVGVGQSEIAVRNMVDYFMLLVLTGAGDELQGMKKGIMEMVDLIVVHKADGDNVKLARRTVREFKRILHHLQPATPEWEATAIPVSSIEQNGHELVWENIQQFTALMKENGYWNKRRERQLQNWFQEALETALIANFFNQEGRKKQVNDLRSEILSGNITVGQAIDRLFK